MKELGGGAAELRAQRRHSDAETGRARSEPGWEATVAVQRKETAAVSSRHACDGTWTPKEQIEPVLSQFGRRFRVFSENQHVVLLRVWCSFTTEGAGDGDGGGCEGETVSSIERNRHRNEQDLRSLSTGSQQGKWVASQATGIQLCVVSACQDRN